MDRRRTIAQRIAKLLRLSRDKAASRFEVESAAALAAKLMLQHNISPAEMDAGERAGGLAMRVLHEGRRLWPEDPLVLPLLHHFYFVRPLTEANAARTRARVVIYGEPGNLPAAEHVYRFLVAGFRRLVRRFRPRAAQHVNRLTRRAVRRLLDSYRVGLAAGLQERLLNERREDVGRAPGGCTALAVTTAALDRRFAEVVPGVRGHKPKPVRVAERAFLMGLADSQRIHLRKAIPARVAIGGAA